MGATLSPPHRCFNMRNPFARAVFIAALGLVLVGLLLHSDSLDVHRRLRQSVNSAEKSFAHQQPLKAQDGNGDGGAGDFTTQEGVLTAAHTPTLGNSSQAISCGNDLAHLRELRERYDLQSKFEYYKRHVRISRQAIDRKSLTKLNQTFLAQEFRTVDMDNDSPNPHSSVETCADPLVVVVSKSPYPSTANLSDFMFGVSTTYKRFSDPKTSSINEWSYWLTDQQGNSNGGKLILLLLGATDDELVDAWTELREVGIDADVYHSDSSMEMAVRYLALVPTLYAHEERPNKKWLVMCDDDTFFPSPHGLVDRFAEFDASKPLYVGTLSEDINNVDRHGSQAFGGAGVFLSEPLAAVVADRFEDCSSERKLQESNTGWGPQGDILLRKCVYENTEVRLTTVWDLWQLDLFGDPSGFYESGIRPLSLHHYRGGGWHIAHPFQYTKLSHLCGEDCMMQRFLTADDWVVSTGFSVVSYPKGVDFDMSQLERTFGAAPDDKGWNLDYMFGPQRKSLLGTGRKISWDLQESELTADGASVSQVYVRRADDFRWVNEDGSPMSRMDGVVELVWTL